MGMEHVVESANRPSWPALRDLLVRHGLVVQMRMIDGQLAFPDESPSGDWKELRVGGPWGMVTLRRDGARLNVVVWGNADDALRRHWNAIAWACATLSGSPVMTEKGPLNTDEFLRAFEMPPSFLPAV